MTLRNILFLGVMTLNLSGCAQVVTKNYEGEKGGTVKYTNELFLKEKNRAKALELAHEYCAPSRARITAEDNRAEFTGHSSSQTRNYGKLSYSETNQSKEQAVYLHFKCGAKKRRA